MDPQSGRSIVRVPFSPTYRCFKAKILRMSYDADGAIQVLQDGLKMEKKNRFKQADSLVILYPLYFGP